MTLTKTVLVYASRAEPGDDMWKCRGSACVYVGTRASLLLLRKANARSVAVNHSSTVYCIDVL